ncbi:hypothetical protein RND81_07G094500 [Saponaria officinalis]
MGVVEDGTVKGKLPSKEVFAVHYPGYPSSMSRAVETLGGLDTIAKVHGSKVNKLELHFRPEDPFSHPAFGQIHPCSSLLLRVSKNNAGDCQTSGCSGSPSQETSSSLSLDIVARVQEAYHFDGMVDYQHVLPVHANVRRKKERINEEKEPVDKEVTDEVSDDDLMILVPPQFSPKDVPENIVLRPSITLSSKKKQEGVVHHRWEMDIEPCLALDLNISEIPKMVNWEQYIPKESDQWKLQMALSKLLDERPIWPRSAISERLGKMGFKVGDYTLKRILFRSAYYFGSGPFHRFWIRKGYDPRKHPESRIYQIMVFRVPPPLRGYCDASSGKKNKWEDLCAFRVFPYKCLTFLQLFELDDDYIQEEVLKLPYPAFFSSSTGWFSSYAMDNLRLRVVLRFLSVFPQGGAEILRKSISDEFEKSKKKRFNMNDPKPGEENESLVNQETSHEEDKSDDINDDELEEEEDEEEIELEDDGVDGMDLDDPTYVGGEDAGFSLQSDSYLGAENISKNYLQELFGSFPTTERASNQLHGADSETEYQIYEQDSDNNNSDDDYY